jgi:hypothetical protein
MRLTSLRLFSSVGFSLRTSASIASHRFHFIAAGHASSTSYFLPFRRSRDWSLSLQVPEQSVRYALVPHTKGTNSVRDQKATHRSGCQRAVGMAASSVMNTSLLNMWPPHSISWALGPLGYLFARSWRFHPWSKRLQDIWLSRGLVGRQAASCGIARYAMLRHFFFN